VGWIVGAAQAKTEGWLETPRLTEQLVRVRDSASELLTHLQSVTADAASRAKGRGPRAVIPTSGVAADLVHAPGKRHRRAPAPSRGVKHSKQAIAKAKLAASARRSRGRG
jgi:hypothetical protein